MISPAELRYFVELSTTLNFSRASERIGISQPSLSAAIKRLEEAIGTPLFLRGKGGTTLTHAGKRLLSHAKELIQLWDNIRSETLASHQEVQGSLILGCHSTVALYALPKFLPKLLLDYPKLEIELQHDLSRKITESVINLRLDMGIAVNPIRHPDLVIQNLYTDRFTFWGPQKITHPHQDIHSGEAIIIGDPEIAQTQWVLKELSKMGIKYRRLITSSCLNVIASLTANDMGIGILPESHVSLLPQDKRLNALTDLPVHLDQIALIYRPEYRAVKSMQTMLQAIKSAFHKEL